jgi:hypothetical protein
LAIKNWKKVMIHYLENKVGVVPRIGNVNVLKPKGPPEPMGLEILPIRWLV